jgi:hypothetical protein
MDIFVEFSSKENIQLCEIMAHYGSDKGAPYSKGHHNYTAYYYNLFRPTNIFKIFVGRRPINSSNPAKNGALPPSL